jgi:predicted dehydrogenase
VTRRKDQLVTDSARVVTCLEIGHPEGYLEAFANLYSDLARAVVARLHGTALSEAEPTYPTTEDGVKGLAFVEAAVRSAGSGRWEPVEALSI